MDKIKEDNIEEFVEYIEEIEKDIKEIEEEKEKAQKELLALLALLYLAYKWNKEEPVDFYRINRNSLGADINNIVGKMGKKEREVIDKGLSRTADHSYDVGKMTTLERMKMKRQGKEMGKSLKDRGITNGKMFASGLNSNKMNKIINGPVNGATYRERLQENSSRLSFDLRRSLVDGMVTGESPGKIIEGMKKHVKSARYKADTILRTESVRVWNEMQYEAALEMGVEEFEFVAVLDERTGSLCQGLNGKVMKGNEVRQNMPPLHPNCRSIIVPM